MVSSPADGGHSLFSQAVHNNPDSFGSLQDGAGPRQSRRQEMKKKSKFLILFRNFNPTVFEPLTMLCLLSFRQKAAANDHDKENQSTNAGNGKKMRADSKKKSADSGMLKKKTTTTTDGHVSSLITTRPARVSLESDPIPRKRKRGKAKENSPAPKE